MTDEPMEEQTINLTEEQAEKKPKPSIDGVYVPIKKIVRMEVTRPNRNAQLCAVEELLSGTLALLMKRKEQEGELSRADWKRFQDVVKMLDTLQKIEHTAKQTSILDGKSNEEILDLVKEATLKMEDENE